MGELGSIHIVPAGRPEADLLVVGCFEGDPPQVDGMEEGIRRAVERLAGRPGWKGKEDQSAQTDAGAGGPVVSLCSLGCRQDLTATKLSRWLFRVAEDARKAGARRLTVALPAHAETSGLAAARRILRVLALSSYRFDRFLSDAEKAGRIERFAVVPPAGEEAAFREALPGVEAVTGRHRLRPRPRQLAGQRGHPCLDGGARPRARRRPRLSTSPCWAPASCAPAAWAACWPSAPAPPTSRAWCACNGGTAAPASPWSARG